MKKYRKMQDLKMLSKRKKMIINNFESLEKGYWYFLDWFILMWADMVYCEFSFVLHNSENKEWEKEYDFKIFWFFYFGIWLKPW